MRVPLEFDVNVVGGAAQRVLEPRAKPEARKLPFGCL
jgi:hypothetical protein